MHSHHKCASGLRIEGQTAAASVHGEDMRQRVQPITDCQDPLANWEMAASSSMPRVQRKSVEWL